MSAAVALSAAITLNLLDGHHAISGADARLAFVPLPLVEVAARRGPDAVVLEGLPPVAFSYRTGAGVGRTTTRLAILNAAYRRTLGAGWWGGIGETLYDQHTTYAQRPGAFYTRFATATMPARLYPLAGEEEQYSRVTGVRIALGRTWSAGSSRIEASAALAPRMHAVQYTYVPTVRFFGSPTFPDPEVATQLDLAVRVVRPAGRHADFLYGVRYLHYSARYVDQPGELADRNLGIAPLVGYRLRL